VGGAKGSWAAVGDGANSEGCKEIEIPVGGAVRGAGKGAGVAVGGEV
jgi:hypothetical protein